MLHVPIVYRVRDESVLFGYIRGRGKKYSKKPNKLRHRTGPYTQSPARGNPHARAW